MVYFLNFFQLQAFVMTWSWPQQKISNLFKIFWSIRIMLFMFWFLVFFCLFFGFKGGPPLISFFWRIVNTSMLHAKSVFNIFAWIGKQATVRVWTCKTVTLLYHIYDLNARTIAASKQNCKMGYFFKFNIADR